MARAEKNSFVLYYELEAQTSILSDEQLGWLLRAVFAYEIRGEYPNFKDDQLLLMCFQFVKTTLDINREKYIERCEVNRENGRLGGRPKKQSYEEPKTNTYEDEAEVPF